MIQIIKLRAFTNEKGKRITYDELVDVPANADTVAELLGNHRQVLSQIPEKARFNLFYTLADCTDKKREFKSTATIAFDIDKTKVDEYERYIEPVTGVLGTGTEDIGIVLSGNGMHFVIWLAEPIKDASWFKRTKAHYSAVCYKINKALEEAGLPGEADSSIFEPRRILRLPGTVNRKPDKPEKMCRLIQPPKKPIPFKLEALSGVPEVQPGDQVDKGLLRKYPAKDPAAVLEGCKFLQACQADPGNVDEPAWYAALSVVARLDGQGSTGWQRCHELSEKHPGYSSEETDQKITQALEASGPRTCQSIQGLWGKCTECEHWGKFESPVNICGDGTIRTEGTGFHHVIPQNNKPPKYVPCYEDLRKAYERDHSYKNLGGSRISYLWKDTHYKRVEKAEIENYAQQKFTRDETWAATNMMVREFSGLVSRTNIMPIEEWWEATTRRKINLENGYLDIDSMGFRPHDTEIGFRNVLPYKYDPSAKAPMFQKMLDMITGHDEGLQRVLLEFMGYALSNDRCWAQKALMLTGYGANGKSTFLSVLKALGGEGNYSSVNLAKADNDHQIAHLDKSLFNISEDTPTKAFRDNATFKNLVTGGTFLSNIKYEKTYEFENHAKLILTCNQLPASIDNTHGFYRRLLIVPFEQTINVDTRGYDPFLAEKIVERELPGVLNLAMEGYVRLKNNKKFSESKKIMDSVEEYRLENDTVLAWVKDCLVVHENGGFEEHFTSMNDMYGSYVDITRENGKMRETVNKDQFAKRLRKLTHKTWGVHPLKDRDIRKYEEIAGRRVRVRGFQGVSIEQIN